jgi:hypothetical protein
MCQRILRYSRGGVRTIVCGSESYKRGASSGLPSIRTRHVRSKRELYHFHRPSGHPLVVARLRCVTDDRSGRACGPSTGVVGLADTTRSAETIENIETILLDSLQSLWMSFEPICIDRSFESPFLLRHRWNISPCHIERIGKGSAASRAEEIDRHCGFA